MLALVMLLLATGVLQMRVVLVLVLLTLLVLQSVAWQMCPARGGWADIFEEARTLFMNFLQVPRTSLAMVAENIMTCLSWGVSLKMACTSARMSAKQSRTAAAGSTSSSQTNIDSIKQWPCDVGWARPAALPPTAWQSATIQYASCKVPRRRLLQRCVLKQAEWFLVLTPSRTHVKSDEQAQYTMCAVIT